MACLPGAPGRLSLPPGCHVSIFLLFLPMEVFPKLPLSPHQRRWLDQKLTTIAIIETGSPSETDLASAPRLDLWRLIADMRHLPTFSARLWPTVPHWR